MSEPKALVEDLVFPEGLCWHEGELWFSDFGRRRVYSVTPGGGTTERAYVPGQPSGVGFRPDGTPLVMSMMDHLVIRLDSGHAAIEADVTEACVGPANDMLVDARGRTYFGAFGYDPAYEGTEALKESSLSMLTQSGEVREVASGLSFPNGMAITSDGGTLIVAETFGGRLTAFSIADDGSLSEHRVFAELGERAPDGICIDADDTIWAGCPFSEEFVHVAEGGEILDVVATPGRWGVCPAIGGDTLYCATAKTTLEDFHHGRSSGAIETYQL